MVRPAVSAGFALPAPQHFFGGNGFATFEGFVGALVKGSFASFNHHAREFMPQDAGETRQPGVIDIPVFIGLGHVHIRTADSAGFDLYQHLIIAWSGNIVFTDLQARIAPNQAAQVSLPAFNVFCSQFEPRLWIPISDQGNTFHFAFHHHPPVSEIRLPYPDQCAAGHTPVSSPC